VTARAAVAAAAERRNGAERDRLAATVVRLMGEDAAIRKSRRALTTRAAKNKSLWQAHDVQVEELEEAEAALRRRGAPPPPERSTLV